MTSMACLSGAAVLLGTSARARGSVARCLSANAHGAGRCLRVLPSAQRAPGDRASHATRSARGQRGRPPGAGILTLCTDHSQGARYARVAGAMALRGTLECDLARRVLAPIGRTDCYDFGTLDVVTYELAGTNVASAITCGHPRLRTVTRRRLASMPGQRRPTATSCVCPAVGSTSNALRCQRMLGFLLQTPCSGDFVSRLASR